MNILYSTGCPKCEVLKIKLKEKGIEYVECNDIEKMRELNIDEVPVLLYNNQLLKFKDAVVAINNQ